MCSSLSLFTQKLTADCCGHFNPDVLTVHVYICLILCSGFKHVSHKLLSESSQHKVNLSPTCVLITFDQRWCLFLKCKVSAGQRGSEEEADSDRDSDRDSDTGRLDF